MIKDNRRFWKLLLFTIPTLGIYNIYFWYRFTQDLNDMNPEEKRIKNYILVWFLSLITLGIYRWVWLFYIEDRLQINGRKLGVKVHPGPGTTLGLWTFGKFILIGPFLADIFIIHNMNKLAKVYNESILKQSKSMNKKPQAKGVKGDGVNAGKKVGTTAKTAAQAAATAEMAGGAAKLAGTAGVTGAARPTGTARPAGTTGSTGTARPAGITGSTGTARPTGTARTGNATKSTGTARTTGTTRSVGATRPGDNTKNVAGGNRAVKVNEEKPKTVNKQVVTKDNNKPQGTPSSVTLDVEKNRPRADAATLTVDMGVSNMPTGKK
jgi:hypothetical protein